MVMAEGPDWVILMANEAVEKVPKQPILTARENAPHFSG
jgi:hypothetical protein